MEGASAAEIFVGLDISRKSVVATAVDAAGNRLSQAKLEATPDRVAEYLRGLPGRKHVALEAGSYWAPLFEAAESVSESVVLSNPLRTRLIADASLKTDQIDSEALATLLRVDALPTAYAPPAETRAVRSLVAERVYYKRRALAVRNRTYSALLRQGIRYEDGILSRSRKRERLRAIAVPEVDRGLDVMSYLEEMTKALDREIHVFWSSSSEAQLLSTIPGVGELTAVALVAYICPIERFSTAEKLSSYIGLCPTTHQSGETMRHGGMKRDSNGFLRWLLTEACWVHCRRVPRGAVARIARRVSHRRGKPQGIGAAAHKLLKIIHAMLMHHEAFRTQVPGPSTSLRTMRRSRTTVRKCVRRPVLEPPTAEGSSAS